MAAAASESGGSGLRADARENRARILAAATATFTEHGDDASLTRIATTAGVGIGTLYRHFPTREHLVEAVHRDRVETVSGKAAVYLATMGAAAALRAWMDDYVEMLVTYRGVPQVLQSQLEPGARLRTESSELLAAAVDRFLAAGRDDGTLRDDVTARDVLRLLTGVAVVTGPIENMRITMDVIVDGLGVTSGRS